MSIFNLPYYSLSHFSYKIYVKCPKCNGLAIITSDKDKYDCSHNSKLYCTECYYVNRDSEAWFGLYQGYIGSSSYSGYACGHCGTKVFKKTTPTKKIYSYKSFNCSQCGREKEYPLYWVRYKKNSATDSIFGLDLYFQKSIKNITLWIYNLEHLEYLKKYLSSTIRKNERIPLCSLVARLPKTIIDKKNKDTIIKALNIFEKELIQFKN